MARVHRRKFLQVGAAASAAWTTRHRGLYAQAADDVVTIGIVGSGGRGTEHSRVFGKLAGVRIAGVCDPDRDRADQLAASTGAKSYIDMREMFASPDIDAVVIATCNHWHALAAAWALEAGKHVYVEKPLTLTHEEGRQLVSLAKQSGLVAAVGTQQRSDVMQAKLKRFLHEERALGKIRYVRVNRFGERGSIGRLRQTLTPPNSVNFDFWLGPAENKPIYRKAFHYDWHWVWNTGSGEMGNWGVHMLDDVRHVALLDKVALPDRVVSAGARVEWYDAGETPNVQFAALRAGETPVLISICNLALNQSETQWVATLGPSSGYVVECEGGRLEGERGRAAAFDSEGRKMREFVGDTGEVAHRQNFIAAVRRCDPQMLRASVEQGHYSTAWCNLPNIATQLADAESQTPTARAAADFNLPEIVDAFDHMRQIVATHGGDEEAFHLGPVLTFDTAREMFSGDFAMTANVGLSRPARAGFQMPSIESGS